MQQVCGLNGLPQVLAPLTVVMGCKLLPELAAKAVALEMRLNLIGVTIDRAEVSNL